MRYLIRIARRWIPVLGMIAYFAIPGSVIAQNPDHPDPDDVAQFADRFFATQLDSLHVPGAVFVVAGNDGVLFGRGYGVADLDTGTPVDADSTLFQVASVSKLFTATAAMQLVESRRVGLDEDVTTYVPELRFDDRFSAPVTLHQLLTHTAGFDERNLGYAARDADSVRPLKEYLLDRMPPRTIPPGTVTSYSNHGFGLVGSIVEEVSGLSFRAYQDAHVLGPLGMSRSTFLIPLPADLADDLATGYRWTGSRLEPTPLLYRNVPPAGALSTTGSDMARFMMAHLGDGALGDRRILDAATARNMHAQQFTNHPALPGMAYGFIEQIDNGRRILQHGGDIPGYSSLIFLIPEEGTGFFMAANVLSNELRRNVVRRFMDRFYPGSKPLPALEPGEDAGARAHKHAGTYRLNRYSRKSPEKLAGTFSNELRVRSEDGVLMTQDGKRWLETAPLVYRRVDGEERLAFRANDDGDITHMFRSIDLGGVVPGAYERLSWYQSRTFLNEFYLSWVPFLLVTWIVWPFAATAGFVWRRVKKRPPPLRTAGPIIARIIAALTSVAMLWFALGFIQPLAQAAARGGGEWIYGIPRDSASLLWLPYLHIALFAALAGFTIKAWCARYWRLPGQIHYMIITLSAAAWLVFLVQYNMFAL